MNFSGLEEEGSDAKPLHAVCMPAPFQSHINGMQMLAKVLHHRGFHVTFVNTDFNRDRLIRCRGLAALDGACDFRFESIPDGLPPSDPNATQDVPSLSRAIQLNLLAPFRQLLARLAADARSSKAPPVTCIFTDGFLPFAYDAGEEFGIPVVAYWTVSASTLLGSLHHRNFIEKGYFPLKDPTYLTNGYIEKTVTDWIPGMKNMRLKDHCSFLRTTDPNDFMFHFVRDAAESAVKASANIINTFAELEPEVLDALADALPRIYSIGPMHVFLKQVPESPVKSIPFNLWKEESECLRWLDSKEPGSVVYVNFGSVALLTPEQLVEFAWGLADSGHSFLWVIRPDLMPCETAVLSPAFQEATRGRKWLAGWCPQEDVLRHPSVGGFLTHCGWNSTLESLAAGVPVICCPFIGDQPTNCRYCCVEWGIGIEVEGEVSRECVVRLVRELIDGEAGRRLKAKALEWKRLTMAAVAPNGSSSVNVDMLIKDVIMRFPK